MSNWCSNTIDIIGDEKTLSMIKEHLESIGDSTSNIVFKTLVGQPPRGKDNSDHWGTKWDVSMDECCFDYQLGCITLSPNTAWGPPLGFCQLLSSKCGVRVDITYSEPGNDISGVFVFDKHGKIIESSEYTYLEGMYNTIDKESFWNEVDFNMDMDMTGNSEDDELKEIEDIDLYIEENYPFIKDNDDIAKIKKLYNEKLNDNGKS